MTRPILACDLRTRTPLRVYLTADGGCIVTDHPLNLIRYASMFVRGNAKEGFTLAWEGSETTFDRYGDAIDCAHNAIGNAQRETILPYFA